MSRIFENLKVLFGVSLTLVTLASACAHSWLPILSKSFDERLTRGFKLPLPSSPVWGSLILLGFFGLLLYVVFFEWKKDIPKERDFSGVERASVIFGSAFSIFFILCITWSAASSVAFQLWRQYGYGLISATCPSIRYSTFSILFADAFLRGLLSDLLETFNIDLYASCGPNRRSLVINSMIFTVRITGEFVLLGAIYVLIKGIMRRAQRSQLQ